MEKKIDITNIYDFLKSVYYNKSASREEFRNFLNDCLKMVFDANNLDLNDYQIILHDAKPINPQKQLTRLNVYNSNIKENEIPPYEICFMWQDDKDPHKFGVCFNRNDTVFKYSNDFDFNDLTLFIYFALHEFAHIIQYIKHPDIFDFYNNNRECAHLYVPAYAETLDTKSKNLVLKAFKKHVDSKAAACKIEKNANAQAYAYLSSLLQEIINQETDLEFKYFIHTQLLVLRKFRKTEFESYRIANKNNKEALATLLEYGICEEELIMN